ncbi:MAG: homocysteine S-methyltransferase family protein [Candidatus Competibacteraceae bacterium]|nr:homocysteine S-methyltransferase family protein [Candidatus Competibacteraceae bacterium]MCB1812570.1 homocysteine S-methyltransferase family protein [Candidatus Competibacteraceae bacterium]
MNAPCDFASQKAGCYYLCEGGSETEIMYKHGFDFPHFAVFELLKDPKAVEALEGMYRSYFEVVAKNNMSALVGGLDYRASPDWGKLLGYSDQGLADVNHECIEFLRNLAAEYTSDIKEILIQGLVGPRGDAYKANKTITENEAQDYHSVQLQTLKSAKVDLVTAITFNNIPESIGIARAAKDLEIPLCISLSLDSSSKLNTGPSLSEAIDTIDAATGSSTAFYMVNCVHPLEYEPALDNADWILRVRGVRPNASVMDKISLCKIGHLEDGNPVELGQQVASLAERYPHMDIFGGCCGTWDTHLDQIAQNLRTKAFNVQA